MHEAELVFYIVGLLAILLTIITIVKFEIADRKLSAKNKLNNLVKEIDREVAQGRKELKETRAELKALENKRRNG